MTCNDCGHTDRGDFFYVLTTKVLCYYCVDEGPE